MTDPTRPLPNLVPQPDGSWTGHTVLTPTALKTRGLFTLPSSRVVPVILVPGIMGTNLRSKRVPGNMRNKALHPGEQAWRPPNGPGEGLMAASQWEQRDAALRQKIFERASLEVDDGGSIQLPPDARNYGMTEKEVRERFWGEVHWDSYGPLLHSLQVRLNHSFEMDAMDSVRVVCSHWLKVMKCDPALWGVRSIDAITEKELEKHANYYFPVYACGYNWLDSCADSAQRLRQRIESTIAFWVNAKRQCTSVILITHSMGGLVARACAKQIPDKIWGVIHGVMPALGAPVCYRRIAGGTETASASAGAIAVKMSEKAAVILGNTSELTTPVMAISPGPLELLPNHRYPGPWLHAGMVSRVNNKEVRRDLVHLPAGDPYALYRNMDVWYRLIDPALVDPADLYKGNVVKIRNAVTGAVNQAEKFHRQVLDTYYHPRTYAFYGSDSSHMSFGSVRWTARDPGGDAVFTEGNLRGAAIAGTDVGGGRRVKVEEKTVLDFTLGVQDASGDGTVPDLSGCAPRGQIRQLFAVRGIDHQGAFDNEAALLLTQHLTVKLVQEMP